MFRLAALNEQTAEESDDEAQTTRGTKEAQEVHAFELYNEALQLQRDQRHDDAIKVYQDLLKTPLVTHAATTLVDDNGEAVERPLKDPGLILKYSTHKNMASMAAEGGDINAAMEHYLQAVMLDTTDVTLWQRIGTHAITLGRLALASHAFICGLKCNENHWPCLDSAVTVLYSLLDYENCLYWIAKALEKDPEYSKGLVLRKKMLKECPHLRRDSESLFRRCSFSIYDVTVDKEEADQYINEALQLREQHHKLCLPKPPNDANLPPLQNISWKCLGESLLVTYDVVMTSGNVSFNSPVRCQNIEDLKREKINSEKEKELSDEIIDVEMITFDDKPSLKTTDNNTIVLSNDTLLPNNAVTADDTSNSQTLEDFVNTTQTTTDDPKSLSQDSIVSPGLLGGRSEHVFIISDISSQELTVNQVSTRDCDVINDVMETLLQRVTSSLDDVTSTDIVKDVLNDIITMVMSDDITDDVIVANLVEELIHKIIRPPDLQFESVNDEKQETRQAPYVKSPPLIGLDDFDLGKLKKVAKKRKFTIDSVIEEHMKRRSSRVRTSSKKKLQHESVLPTPVETKVDYRDRLVRLLPQHLKILPQMQDDGLTHNADNDATPNESSPSVSNPYSNEADDVIEFIEMNDGNLIVEFMQNYCSLLSNKINLAWEKGTLDVLVSVFSKSQSHIQLPHLSDVTDLDHIKNMIFTMLSCVEFNVDCDLRRKLTGGCKLHELDTYFDFLASVSERFDFFKVDNVVEGHDDNLLNRDWKAFVLRFLWARSKHNTKLQQTQSVINDLETCKEILQKVRTNALSDEPYIVEPADLYVIKLPNMEFHRVISLATMNERLKLLERSQILEDANKFFEQESYAEVVKMLKPTVKKQIKFTISSNQNRARQIRQLVVSCQQLSDYPSIVRMSGFLFHEVIMNITEATKNKPHKKPQDAPAVASSNKASCDLLKQWSGTLHVLLQALDKCVIREPNAFCELDDFEKIVLTHGIIEIIRYMLLRLDNGHSFNDAGLVWILMYKVLKFEERMFDLESEDDLPPSFELLDIAHKCMGEWSLCCTKDGMLLKYIVTEIQNRFQCVKRSSLRDEICGALEQSFYCMYAFPNKTKTKRVQDHGAKQLVMTWSDYLLLFRHFRPMSLPEFDSFKTSTVSVDLSQLLLRALTHVPSAVTLKIPNTEEEIISYIEGGCSKVATFKSPSDDLDLLTLGDMYYLLADYYFKNNEMTKAVRYYLLDLRINPARFDSWSGMALARSSQTDDRLRLCETKKSQHKLKDSGTERRGLAALACFKRALSFDSNSVKLWIEYGSLAYWMHSMYSRKTKRKGTCLNNEDVKKREMLNLSRLSFESVMKCESEDIYDEEWFVHYMLGKLCEKEGKNLKTYLKLYQSAAMLLHKRHAKYPKKILAKYGSVNELSIEALEMHFRIHASIMKYVMSQSVISDEDVTFMKNMVDELASSPFATRSELKMANMSMEVEKSNQPSKLTVTSQSSDLTMGSLLPDCVLQALNIEEPKTDEDTQSSAHSLPTHSVEQSVHTTDTGGQIAIAPDSADASREVDADDVHMRSEERHKADCDAIVDACEAALRLCICRFPQHNKAIYRLAHLYAKCENRKQLTWSRDLLYGSSVPWQHLRHMTAPGLLSDRNKTNLFNGVWRIPMDDIDRPGSFAAHVYRCMALLLDVLCELRHNDTLLHIHNMLHRTPEHGRKYLREGDRLSLARRAVVYCRAVLNRKLKSSFTTFYHKLHSGVSIIEESIQNSRSHEGQSENNTQEPSKMESVKMSLSLLMEAYKLYQDTQKHSDVTIKVDSNADPDDITHQRLLVNAYRNYTCCVTKNISQSGTHDNQNTLEDAVRFCQQQSTKKQTNASSNTKTTSLMTSPPKQPINVFKPVASASYRSHDLAAVQEVRELKIDDDRKFPENGVDASTAKADEEVKSFHPSIEKASQSQGKVTIVEKGGVTYTRIGPVKDNSRAFAPSPDSAFRSTVPQDGVESKKLKMDPQLRHLRGSNDPSKRGLFRSTSVPVSYPEGEENTPPHHRPLYRTGSFVSDYTKNKLKSAILAKKSAALVRKPSITDQEMMQIHGDADADSDSSQSDDEDYDTMEGVTLGKRKFSDDAPPTVSTNEPPSLIPTLQPTVITTAGST